MAESTLAMGYPDIAKAIGRYLGYRGDSTQWTADEADEIAEIVKRGLRQFYYPPAVDARAKSYEWRFLKPVTTLATVAADYDYDLPDAFGFMIGDLSYPAGTSLLYPPVKIIGEGDMRNMRQAADISGRPQFSAVRPKSTTGATGQRYELILYPTPDAVYTLTYQYSVLPDKIDASFPYPYGGMIHTETILASCMAIAELVKDDEKGIHYQTFMERLAASVSQDKNNSPQIFGYNGDMSGETVKLNRTTGVTYKGVQY